MVLQTPKKQLKFKSPPGDLTARKLISSSYDRAEEWRKEWASFSAPNRKIIPDPNQGVPGMNLSRSTWSTLNKLRTDHGRCDAYTVFVAMAIK